MSALHKKVWKFFFMGLAVGFLLSLTIYFIDKYYFNDAVKFSSTVENFYATLFKQKENELKIKEQELEAQYEEAKKELQKKLTQSRPKIEPEVIEVDSNQVDFSDPDFQNSEPEAIDTVIKLKPKNTPVKEKEEPEINP